MTPPPNHKTKQKTPKKQKLSKTKTNTENQPQKPDRKTKPTTENSSGKTSQRAELTRRVTVKFTQTKNNELLSEKISLQSSLNIHTIINPDP